VTLGWGASEHRRNGNAAARLSGGHGRGGDAGHDHLAGVIQAEADRQRGRRHV